MSIKRLLIVEDIPRTIIGTMMELEASGYSYLHVMNVGDAKAALAREHFDALILDWSIPMSAGAGPAEEAAGTLLDYICTSASNTLNIGLPFIILTAHPNVVNESKLRLMTGYIGIVYKLFVDDIKMRLDNYFANPQPKQE